MALYCLHIRQGKTHSTGRFSDVVTKLSKFRVILCWDLLYYIIILLLFVYYDSGMG